MVSKAKLYSQLDRLEEELRERIVPHLKEAAAGNNNLVFCTSDFNSLPGRKQQPDAESDALVQLGRQILVLRDKLGESSGGTVAERICWYCREWVRNADDRKSAQVLATAFLQELTPRVEND
ncbi:MAG: hypothetical protein AB8G18_06280 [Gammaproteobacteria bacterium]